MIDALNYMVPRAEFSLEYHLEAPENPVYAVLQPGKLWYLKSPAGFPWDMYTWDATFIYQKLTENLWTDPKTFKAFVSTSWPGGGIAWCPRLFDPGTNPSINPMLTADSSFKIFTSCATSTESTLGQVQTSLHGPFVGQFGGNLPLNLEAIAVNYQWNNGATLETNYYAKGYGLVRWTTADLVSGLYVPAKVVSFNHIAPGGSPSVVFPCPIP